MMLQTDMYMQPSMGSTMQSSNMQGASMQSYEGEAWWSGQQQDWSNAGYDQMQYDQQYDVSNWGEYGCFSASAETSQQQTKVGWNSSQLQASWSSDVGTSTAGVAQDSSQMAASAGTWVAQARAQSSSWQVSEAKPSEEPGAEPKAGAELLTELRLAELKRLIDKDAAALKKSPGREDSSKPESLSAVEDPQEVPAELSEASATRADLARDLARASATGWRMERRAKARAEKEEQTKMPPGLDLPPEQSRLVLVDFDPVSRKYGEMPVRAGEKVVVNFAPIEDWIFGRKQGDWPDKGWLPAQCLGFGVSLSDAETSAEDDDHQFGHRKASGKVRISPEEEKGEEDDEAWHHHGNWWSRQRHLKGAELEPKAPKPVMPPQAVSKDARPKPRSTGVDEHAKQRVISAAMAPATADKAGKAAGRGKGAVERTVRERTALSNLLDRLNKPLVAPKPA